MPTRDRSSPSENGPAHGANTPSPVKRENCVGPAALTPELQRRRGSTASRTSTGRFSGFWRCGNRAMLLVRFHDEEDPCTSH